MLEHVDWCEFIGAQDRSPSFANFVDEIPRLFVALRGRDISARTCAQVAIQLMIDVLLRGGCVHVLNRPTNEAWISPWLAHLRSLGVETRLSAEVEAIHVTSGKVASVTVCEGGRRQELEADYFICALPAHVVPRLLPKELKEIDGRLAGIEKLPLGWMNGIQFFLGKELTAIRGHLTLLDSPWAITAVAQKQFWPEIDLSAYGDGTVRDIVSICISDWETPGILHGRPAVRCSREEIKDEVWAQLKRSMNRLEGMSISDRDMRGSFLDLAITWDPDGQIHNQEPLVMQRAGTLALRPHAITRAKNFFLAGDYVRTNTDLVCMEGACESARRAVNGVLAEEGATVDRCKIWALQEPTFMAPFQAVDRVRMWVERAGRLS